MKGTALLEIKRLFLAASELPPGERAHFLAAQRGIDPDVRARVEAQLSRLDDGDDALASPGVARFEEHDPESIGPYRVLRRLGDGGMGVVYLAEQTAPVIRKVAVKRIKAGMDSAAMLRRFETERQAIARMDHPAIARVLDAGIDAAGRPFFAMEYVDGVPVVEFCDREQLDTDARLRLFVDICRGVQHAHQKGVLHRDLKPSNVLVTTVDGRPVPKIIDFGVAKALEQHRTGQTVHTQLGVLIGTPEYMSPEQAEPGAADVDTRSDVYSLGVLLYELLSGELPFSPGYLREQGVAGIQRVLQHEDPPRPSTRVSTRISTIADAATARARMRRSSPHTLAQRLRGDLDWVTMRALEKDRDRRYASPGEFAADIERHLRCEPVLAGPPTARYRARKFLRRYRAQVVTVAAVSLSLLVGTAVSVWFAIDAHALSDELAAAQLDVEKENAAVAAVLDKKAKALGKAPGADTHAEAQMRVTLGTAYAALGRYRDATQQLARAIEMLREIPAAWPHEVYDAIREYMPIRAGGLGFVGNEGFDGLRNRAAAEIVTAGSPELEAAWEDMLQLADDDPGEQVFAMLWRRARERFRDDDPRWIVLADTVCQRLGALVDRAATAQEVLAVYRRSGVPASDPGFRIAQLVALQHYNWPAVHRHQDAWELSREVLATAERSLPRNHWYIGLVSLEAGWAGTRIGRFAEAEPHVRRAVTILDASCGEGSVMAQWALASWIDWYDHQERGDEALPLRHQLARRLGRQKRRPGKEVVAATLPPELSRIRRLVSSRSANQPLAEAVAIIDAILVTCRAELEPADPAALALAAFVSSEGQDLANGGVPPTTIRRIYQWVLEVQAANGSPDVDARFWLTYSALQLGDFQSCAAVASAGLQMQDAAGYGAHYALLENHLGVSRFRVGDAAAIDLAIQGYRRVGDLVGEDNGNTNECFERTVASLAGAGDRARARALVAERRERLRDPTKGPNSHNVTAWVAANRCGDDALAANLLASMQERFAGALETIMLAAELHAARFDRAPALACIARAAELGRGNRYCQDDMARLYSRLGELEKAEACSQCAIDSMARPPFRNNQAVWLLRFGEVDRAQQLLEALVKDYPDDAFAHANLADCWRRRGDLDRALVAAERSFTLHRDAGRFDLLMTRFARGEDAVDLCVEEAESNVRPHGNGFWPTYTEALSRAGRLDEVRARLARMTDEWPTEPFAWSARALSLCTTTGVTDEDRRTAVQCAQRSVELSNRQGPVMLAALAEAHFQNGDGPAAIEAIDACLQVMDGHDVEWLTLADAEQRRRRYLGR